MNIHPLVQFLTDRVQGPLPGENAHKIIQVNPKINFTFPNRKEKAIPAAVLILLFPHNGDISFFLTERSQDVEHHKGQVSLPGGAWEEGEKLYETALRETHEEIGVDPHLIHFIGGLSPFFTPVTGFMVHPFLAWADTKPKATPHDKEVETLFTASLSSLMNQASFKKEYKTFRDTEVLVPFYDLSGHQVWGVTAAILSELNWLLKDNPEWQELV